MTDIHTWTPQRTRIRDVPATLTIPAGLNGPADTANGGIAAGMLAQYLDSAAEVRLHQPPPLNRTMTVTQDEKGLMASIDNTVILSAQPATLGAEIPDVGVDEAPAASTPPTDHAAPTCVVCGPEHPQSLRLFPGPIGRDDIYACTWEPPAWTLDADSNVRTELVWGILDCSASTAVGRYLQAIDETVFPALGTIAVDIREPVEGGEPLVTAGWPTRREGRKLFGGAAVLSTKGTVHAAAAVTCISLPIDWARGAP